jgi:diacylglycerol kinase family enzyme
MGALSVLFRILTGRFEGHNDLRYLSVEHVLIDARPPLPTQVDGEAVGSTPLEAKAVPGGALLVVPQSYRPGGSE